MFLLDNTTAEPLYAQLARQIRDRARSGALAPDSRLPSVRDLSRELGVSRNTVECAYLDLHAEGYIYARPRSGYYVASQPDDEPRSFAAPASAAPARHVRPLKPWLYDFHPAGLDKSIFPASLWRKYYLESLRASVSELASYGDVQGDPELRRRIRDYLESSRGVACSTEQVVVCSGLQHSLSIVAVLLRQDRPRVAMENPGYFLARSVLRNHGLEVVPIPVRSGGMDLDALERSGCQAAYVTPSHQFPLGHVMPVENRQRLAAWASEPGRVVVEDDYDSELRYRGKPVPSLHRLAPDGGIVYTGTFSKILSPALRLSYMVLPSRLLPAYRSLFANHQATVPLLEQKAMARFMEHGNWERHIRRARTGCARKHDALLRAVDSHFGDCADIIGQGAGLHVVLRVRGTAMGEDELLERAGAAGVRLFPYSRTLDSGGRAQGMLLLGFGAMTPAEIDQGVGLLAGICLGQW
ncbi:MAG: PLP-dependent aminotransferase family protein [Thermodesulfobacteriota bacterium]